MGPILIFDKSFLQSLNPDEAMWLDNFFNTNITPLFFIETLADLEKEVKSGRKPEDIVGSLAYKTPDMSAKPNVHHQSLIAGELMGAGTVSMTYRPIIGGGKTVKSDGKIGILFKQSPEEEALDRWQKGEFLEIEKVYAKQWRQELSNINLGDKYILFQKFFSEDKPKTLGEIKILTDQLIDSPDQEYILTFGMWLVGLPWHSQEKILKRWHTNGKPLIRQFAPYFTHVLSVDLFFYLAIAADIISHSRASHKIDIAYLYYLPFCSIFTSSDKLHQQVITHFLTREQSFIPGPELKIDLKNLDDHYTKLPDDIKARGVSSFAMYPPQNGSFLVCQLWDKYMAPDWRKRIFTIGPQPKNKASETILKQLKEEFRQMENGAALSNSEAAAINSDEAHHIVIKRMVRKDKGKWQRFPPEVLKRRKNQNGQWEDLPPDN